ncbi:MAG: GAF domain-containing protein, partial [Candidatus Eremiobacteraeota bacterium]|nr:GAF domain-containing protein [Candidatus Eremiobacteraeota bacterium]
EDLLPSEIVDSAFTCAEHRRTYLAPPLVPWPTSMHQAGGFLLVELELEEAEEPEDHHVLIQTALARLETARTVERFVEILAEEMRRFLDVERAMVYRFLPDWTGDIVAESCRDGVEQLYKGLRFPATDIPTPAREVFRKNWSREIRDVCDQPVPLEPFETDLGNRVDLSRAVSRAPSPIHVDYLKNMEVGSSFTGSLRVGEELWGLVACHHSKPLSIGLKKRSSLELFMEMASMRLASISLESGRDERRRVAAIVKDYEDCLKNLDFLRLDVDLDCLRRLVTSDAVAVFQSNSWKTDGTLRSETLYYLKDYLESRFGSETMIGAVTDCPREVSSSYPGVLFLKPGPDYGIYWLAQADEYSIRWAGDPRKAEYSIPTGQRLEPRSSFQEYVQTIENQSSPWSELDFRSTRDLGAAIQRAALYIAERSELQKQALQRSNEELEAFAFMASHDLQEPIRGIFTYTETLLEDHELGPEGEVLANNVLALAERMNLLIRDLLHYAKLGDRETFMADIDTHQLVKENIDFVFSKYAGRIELEGTLPPVYGYETFVSEIFTNLLSNAVKYTEEEREIFVGSEPSADPNKVVFYVRDNGIGIHPDHHGRIFNLFRRLHPPAKYGGGSGA